MRLYDVSWFMKCLNEHLARRANQEDNCTGKFWEGRLRSQALLDEAGLLKAMVYVDLNPIRPAIAAAPEESEYTSVCQRIRELGQPKQQAARSDAGVPLVHFHAQDDEPAIPYRLEHYLQLVDWTGRAIRSGKRGFIDAQLPPIMERLGIDIEAGRLAMRPRGNVFERALGRLGDLRLHAKTLGQSWARGLGAAQRLYSLHS